MCYWRVDAGEYAYGCYFLLLDELCAKATLSIAFSKDFETEGGQQ